MRTVVRPGILTAMSQKVDARLASLSSPALSIFRIIFGLLFTLHGTMKLFGWPVGEAVPVGTWPCWLLPKIPNWTSNT